MFRPKSKQKSIFDHDVYLPAEKVEALEKTWAGPFRRQVLPMIDEEPFRPFYCPDNGRPNVPVAILIGLCVLKEMHELTDQETSWVLWNSISGGSMPLILTRLRRTFVRRHCIIFELW